MNKRNEPDTKDKPKVHGELNAHKEIKIIFIQNKCLILLLAIAIILVVVGGIGLHNMLL